MTKSDGLHLSHLKLMLPALIFLCSTPLFSQTRDIEILWQQQMSRKKTDSREPQYLEIDEETILELFNSEPSFGMLKDNYFITGVPVNKGINKHTADAKFQISISQRLTKTVLPFNTFLMLTYTQISFWNIYDDSSPFEDSNYNPGLLIGKPIVRNNQFKGIASIAFEHESNGQPDGINDRACNYFAISGIYFFNRSISIQTKLWAGWLASENSDLYKYRGYGLVAINYLTTNSKFWMSAIINPRPKFGNFNTQLELNLKLNTKMNQYLFLQWYDGYGESLLNYNKYTSMVRIGICIKPPARSNFY